MIKTGSRIRTRAGHYGHVIEIDNEMTRIEYDVDHNRLWLVTTSLTVVQDDDDLFDDDHGGLSAGKSGARPAEHGTPPPPPIDSVMADG